MKINNNTDFNVIISKAIIIWFWTIIFGASISISLAFMNLASDFRIYYLDPFTALIAPLGLISLALFFVVWILILQSLPFILNLLLDIILGFSGNLALSSVNEEEDNQILIRFLTKMKSILYSLTLLIISIATLKIILIIYEILGRF